MITKTADNQGIVTIEKQACNLLRIMGFSDIKISRQSQDITDQHGRVRAHLRLTIDAGPAGKILIGAHGNNLDALQHIIRSLVRRQSKDAPYVTVDINGYLASRERSLLRLAEEAARQAGHTGRAVILPPMTATQRRTIHTSLASRQEIFTESLGDEPNRRVVVRPTFI